MIVAVGLTTIAVAAVARFFVPELAWAPAIALGAIVAPPDAVAATAVLRPLKPPHRILTILEGESLLNDASSLLIYRLAVGAVAAGGFSVGAVGPALALSVVGSLIVGPALGWLASRLFAQVEHVPTAIILQFTTTFGVWILAEDARPVSRVDDGVLRRDGGAELSTTNGRSHARADLRRLGNGGVRTEHFRVHFHRPADAADSREP